MAEGLRTDFPPLRSLESFQHNLPPQRSSFVGREHEIAEVRKLIENHRLVTLTGVGGCGKTRLSLQVAAEVLDEYPDGVFFVDLAPITDETVIAPTIAVTVGLSVATDARAGPAVPIEELLLVHLERRKTLLVFDNCEHLLDASAGVADEILSRCPDVRIVATSREPLDVEGEQTWRVPSLSVPDGALDADASEAVSLFTSRARSVRPGFDLTAQNVEAVVEVCRRLDGIPLAIEFAASRVSHMSPQEIASRLNDLFRLLTGGRHRIQRQQTLETALDWSHGLLSDDEQALLRRLAVFSGTFSLDAVEGICSGDGVEGDRILDDIASLVAKSLVTIEESDGRTRYRLIETIRQYAAKKLHDAGEADRYRIRHRDWYQARVESYPWQEVFRPFGVSINPEWTNDIANIRAALEWSDGEGRGDLVIKMAAHLHRLWLFSGFFDEGYRWLERADAPDVDVPIEDRVAALVGATIVALVLSKPTASSFADRAVEIGGGRRCIPVARALAWRAITRSIRAAISRDPDLARAAREDMSSSIAMTRTVDPGGVGEILSNQGNVEMILGDMQAAEDAYGEAVAAGAPLELGVYRAAAAHILGHNDIALEAVRPALQDEDSFLRLGTWASYFVVTAVALAGAGEFSEARRLLVRHVETVRRSASLGSLEEMILGFAVIAHLSGDPERASILLGWIGSRTLEIGRYMPSGTGPPLYVHYIKVVREALDGGRARECRSFGRALSEDEAISMALLIDPGNE
jgi:predicted ATPase